MIEDGMFGNSYHEDQEINDRFLIGSAVSCVGFLLKALWVSANLSLGLRVLVLNRPLVLKPPISMLTNCLFIISNLFVKSRFW